MISRGLINVGNTCYLNSVIQCITHLFLFNNNNINFTIDIDINKKNNFLLKWLQLQNDIVQDTTTPLNISDFINELTKEINKSSYHFDSFDQNDTSEFITILFDLLHNSIKTCKNMVIEGNPQNDLDKIALNSMKSWIQFFKNDYSYIISSSYSQLLSKTECSLCKYNTFNYDPIQIITLDNMKLYNLNELLNNYITPYQLDSNNEWKCDKCHKLTSPIKHNVFWNLSEILIIQFKLYDNFLRKINKKIQFPIILETEPYNLNYNRDNTKYKLYGMCCHVSNNRNFGHYYSVCYNKYDHKWRKYNDSNITLLSESNVLNETPYCLFYVRI